MFSHTSHNMWSIWSSIIDCIESIFIEQYAEPRWSLILLDDTLHYREDFPEAHFDGVYIACQYDAMIEKNLAALKYHWFREYASLFLPLYRALLDRFLPEIFPQEGRFLITGIPIHWTRFLRRGFNQTTLLARSLAEIYPQFHYARVIGKTRYTRHQAHLSRTDRLTNPRNAYQKVWWYDIRDMDVLVIDDVISTGATFESCAEVLKKAGARSVYGFFLSSNK